MSIETDPLFVLVEHDAIRGPKDVLPKKHVLDIPRLYV